MAEDGLATLSEFRQKFDELGGCDLSCSLIMATPGVSVQAEATTETLDFQNLVIVNERGSRQLQELAATGVSMFRKDVFTVWGGVLDMSEDDETPLGRSSVIVPKLQKAMNGGGGVLYGDELLALKEFHRGLVIGQVVMEWFLVCEGKSFDTL